MTAPRISAVICTYNRADRLILALDGLQTQTLPWEQFEIVVIDNASTDNTKAVCADYQQKLPYLVYQYEPIQGLSTARNTGLKVAKGDYIAYLDDDAIPCANWLEDIVSAFTTVEPQPAVMGGPIYPIWEKEPPVWMHYYVQGYFTILDHGPKAGWFPENEYPYGANMIYRRDVLLNHHGFSEELGRDGKSLLSDEERLLNLTIEANGGRFYYLPSASVQHWIPKERISRRWLLKRCYWQGRSGAVVDQTLGVPLTQQRIKGLRGVFSGKRWVSQILPDPQRRIRTGTWLVWYWGYLQQTFYHEASP
ncbi:glycosyltransferase [Leptothoe spongobia]|uniref:Glycosyltransferase family 2 protein n=1 Tax=Leptothoe spongobia TAU-MAC 1115 TaxID=1967444 RepID=A0A947DIA0_9CYAN|nr:glycosyltransferase [Leptothoe spongobia]MBT9317528.1 glycosyltransferase family 2 protein [Leptothoe spongobia TAU-MAC 1115]